MEKIWAERALLPDGWAEHVCVTIDAGRIARVEPGAAPQGRRVALLLPALANLHSHAFQRAMAGLSEGRGPEPRDTFWTWRRIMYRFLDRLTPEDVESSAALVQMEMLEAGYATNVEFHYLHHGPGGAHYGDIAEMAGRVAAAAARTGIGLTLLPVHYQFGGVDRRALAPGQNRFGTTPEEFARLVEGAETALRALPADAGIGIAPHSLRAVSPEGLAACVALRPDRPLHMHLAEQIPEIEEISAAYGRRPVEWLLDNHQPDRRWTLIHLTHMTEDETRRLAATGAVAGLCPITESSLGDGIFTGTIWAQAGGRYGFGSDSHIRRDRAEFLRHDPVAIAEARALDLFAHDGDGQRGLARRVDGHMGAGAALAVQKPFLGQKLQGLVHRGAGDAEFDRQFRLVGDAVALPPYAVDDAAAHLAGDGLSLGKLGGLFGHMRS